MTSRESKQINEAPTPKIIIAGSGMSQGGRIVHHEVRYLSDPKNSLLQVGYQAEGTLGRLLHDGVKNLDILDQPIEVRARIEKISGYSAHADQEYLMNWLRNFKKPCYDDENKECHSVKKVFVVQGEEGPAETLACLIRDELGIEAMSPKMGESVEI
jgi:metallo-beta-lactamase family protein